MRGCEIRHLSLLTPPEPIFPTEAGCSVFVLFWWREMPLGSVVLSPGELPVPASAVPALAAAAVARALRLRGGTICDPTPEGALTALAEEAKAAGPVSVIVCTGGRPLSLARCLDSLLRCDPAPAEIIVVDNAPDEPGTREVVAARPAVRRVPEPRRGLSFARNAGLAASTGEIIAFTDDDVEVAPNWLTPIRAAFEEPDVGCVTGLVLPASLDTEAEITFEFQLGGLARSFLPARYDRTFLDRPFWVAPPVWLLGAGANLALRRAALKQVGLFDVRLGAGAAGCSEDSEFLHRLLQAGWVCRYEPAAVVYHRHRATSEQLCQQMRAYMKGHVAALLVQFGSSGRPEHLVRAFIELPFHFGVSVIQSLLEPRGLGRKVLGWKMLGYLEGFAALRGRGSRRFDQALKGERDSEPAMWSGPN